MSDFEKLYIQGTAPTEKNYPGLHPRVMREKGMLIERDTAVPMRDGVRIYVDILRPENGPIVPAVIAWSPYGKHNPRGGYARFPGGAGVKPEWVSSYAAFEGPDPLYWVPHGYAVINVDPRGMWGSEGDATFWSQDEARDYYDLIEWAAAQGWCNGRIGMTGVSYLAITQWLVAAMKPPHLAAMNPWEGFSDMYREIACHGGIPETLFINRWHGGVRNSLGLVEDVPELAKRHPLFDGYWADKTSNLSAIETPAYVVASWTDQGLHTRGSIEGFKQMTSKHKWLEVHGRKKWEYYLQPESVERQRKFFDHFLKGTDDDVLRWPKVRVEVRESYYAGEVRSENEWPLARTEYEKLYLDARNGSLNASPPLPEAEARYEAQGDELRCPAAYRRERVQFDHVFAEATELTGNMKLKLWVEAVGADDMDLFVAVQKFDRKGNPVLFPFFALLEDGPVALGWLRASHRELDPKRSTAQQPWLAHQRELKLQAGVPVCVEIEILPSSTRFAVGETLRLVVQGSDIYQYSRSIPMIGHMPNRNAGQHVIRTGGRYDSHLLVPVIPR